MCRGSECCLALFILGLGRRSIAAGSGEEMPVGQVTAARTMCKLFRMCKPYANYLPIYKLYACDNDDNSESPHYKHCI